MLVGGARSLAPVAGRPSETEIQLLDAVRRGDAARTRALLEADVGVEARSERGATPLIVAAENGFVGIVRLLYEAGADVDARDSGPRSWPALMHALHADQPTSALMLLSCGADPNAHEESGYSALMMAASRGDRWVVEELLDRGADPSARLFLGFTALDYAIGYGHGRVVGILLAAAPELRRRSNAARRAVLALAARSGDAEILDMMA